MTYRDVTDDDVRRIVGELPLGWYALRTWGVHSDKPAGGPYRTGREVVAALLRFYDRCGVFAATCMRQAEPILLGPYVTRQLARDASRYGGGPKRRVHFVCEIQEPST